MAAWTRKASTKAGLSLASCVPAGVSTRGDGGGDDKQQMRIPKGYLPIVLVLVGDGDDDEASSGGGGGAAGAEAAETRRVLVRVRDLKEPCMAALLELAEQQFGYGQQGVLRVPCDAQRFHHVLNMARKSKVRS